MARPTLSDKERFSRRTALLEAAQHIYRANGTLPTVRDIAKAAGIAKGAVYLWFRTKGEIFVALLNASFGTLIDQLLPIIQVLGSSPFAASRDFASNYAKLLADTPDLLPLAVMFNTILKNSVPNESVYHFNENLGAGLSEAGNLLEQRIGTLLPGEGADLLLRTWTLTVGLWEVLDLPASVRKALDAPALSILHRNFHAELETAVTQLWRGAMTAHRLESGEESVRSDTRTTAPEAGHGFQPAP